MADNLEITSDGEVIAEYQGEEDLLMRFDASTVEFPGRTIVGDSDDQTAAEVPFTPAGDVAATDVQAAIEEVDSEKVGSAATDASGFGFVVDEDGMVSDSATKVPTQQSVKAYVDTRPAPTVDASTIAALNGDTHEGIPGTSNLATVGDWVHTANRLMYSVFFAPRDLRITAVYVDIGAGAAAGTLRVGVTKLDADLFPATSGVVGEDATIDPSTAGLKSVTGLTWDLEGGQRYASLFTCSVGVTTEYFEGVALDPRPVRFSGTLTEQLRFMARAGFGTGSFGATVSDPTLIADESANHNAHFMIFDYEDV